MKGPVSGSGRPSMLTSHTGWRPVSKSGPHWYGSALTCIVSDLIPTCVFFIALSSIPNYEFFIALNSVWVSVFLSPFLLQTFAFLG